MLYEQARTVVFAIACVGGLSVPVVAEELKFMAELTGQGQVPPIKTAAAGTADVIVDTEAMTVMWKVTYQGLSGTPIAAHFHGPAEAGENAPPVIDMGEGAYGATADVEAVGEGVAEGGTASETEGTDEAIADELMEGSAQLTDHQLSDLQAGRYYINLHTAQHPDGEIRGQVVQGEAVRGEAETGAVDGAATEALVPAAAVDLAVGEKLFKTTCRTCHGPKAQGMASFPKLAGKDADYLLNRLNQYHAGETVGPNSKLMIPVAKKLSDEERASVSAYIAETFQ